MDNLGSTLPPMPDPNRAAPPGMAFVPGQGTVPQVISRSQVPGNPVGRPSSDPEVQEQKRENAEMRKRLNELLPDEMRDGCLAVFRLSGRAGKLKSSPTRPAMKIPLKELEDAKEQGDSVGDFLRGKVMERFANKGGRYLVEALDRRGRVVSDFGSMEINLDSEDEDEDDDGMLGGEEEDDGAGDFALDDQPRRSYSAPPPPPFNPATHASEIREVLAEEKKASNETMSLVMTLMQSQQQQQQQLMLFQQQQAEIRRQEEERRRAEDERRAQERAEREERERERREERERAEKKERKDQFMQLLPLILPMLQKLMEPKPDTTTPLLMKMLEGKNDKDGMKEVFSMMNESSKQAMLMQGEASRHMMAAQAEAAKSLIGNVMGISKTMVESTIQQMMEERNRGVDGDDGGEKPSGFDKIFSMLGPVMQMIAKPPEQPPVVAPQAVIPAAQPMANPQQAAPQQAQPQLSEAERIRAGLYTIMRMEGTGVEPKLRIPPQQRLRALEWCAKHLPKSMLDAIRSGEEGEVLSVGAQGMDQALMEWISDEKRIGFLRDAIEDIRKILVGTWDEAAKQLSMQKHAAYFGGTPVQAEVMAEPAPAPQEAPKKRTAPPPPADSAAPAEAAGEAG